jgi:hypothetical protein
MTITYDSPINPGFSVDFVAADELASATAADQNEEMEKADPMATGFIWYAPPMKVETTKGYDWIISGHDMQVLTSTIPPGVSMLQVAVVTRDDL